MNKAIPDFLVIGAAKSGTTTLITDLRHHPGIYTPGVELNYFTKFYENGTDWYLSRFGFPEKVQGEKSTSYLYSTRCHKRIFDYNPEIKLIILLRDPVKRAYSNWNMRFVQHRLLYQAHLFNIANKFKIENIGFAHIFNDYLACNPEPFSFQEPMDIFKRGLYIDQIEHLLRFFKPEQILILISEYYFADPLKELTKVSNFLHISDFQQNTFAWKRKSEYPVPLDEKVALEIYHYYKPYNERLFNFLGFEIPEWQR